MDQVKIDDSTASETTEVESAEEDATCGEEPGTD